jgi:molybdenum cofactor cytidylyltransferase
MNNNHSQPIAKQWAVVVLAAGRSSRMGRPKQLVMVDGESMVRNAVKVALAAQASQVVLVTGAYAEDVGGQVIDLVEATGGLLSIVHNPDWAEGQATSMHAGLKSLPDSCGAAIFAPVDQPFMPPLLLNQLGKAWQAGARVAAPSVEGELRGAPSLFDRSLWPELLEVQGDVGGRTVLRAHASEVQRIDVPAAWLRDLDTPDDLVERPVG